MTDTTPQNAVIDLAEIYPNETPHQIEEPADLTAQQAADILQSGK